MLQLREISLNAAIGALERGLIPDSVVRFGIDALCATRLRHERKGGHAAAEQRIARFVDELRQSPIALLTEKANEQHYELPPEFFRIVLGPHLKYSSCLWDGGATTLGDAEAHALSSTVEHAELRDGMRILELGCGWGSLTLWMAEHFPHSEITAVSNSTPQRTFIEARARERGIGNVRVITADMNTFQPATQFDRVVSVEMFEHMRNYDALLLRIASWLVPDGKLFVHVFCHRELAYPFETEGADNWLGRYFFSGGLMPSIDLLRRFDRDLRVEDQWLWNGTNYEKTANAWLENLDRNRAGVRTILARCYGDEHAERWLYRWRVFFMACAELFGYRGGREWLVAHYRFARRA